MLFKNQSIQKQFDLNGYVVLPFLNEKQIATLHSLFTETHPEVPEGFYSSSFSSDTKQKGLINESIENVLSDRVDDVFSDIKKLGSCFLNKKSGISGEMPIHQDWTVVDEPHFDSVTIWIPLQDVDEQNGAIQVIEGSHRFTNALRAPTLDDPFKNISGIIRKDLKTIRLKAGEAFIFSHALLHASPPNLSPESRIAVTYGLVSQQAELSFYHKNDDGLLEKYQVSEDFFQTYNTQIGSRPTNGKQTSVFPYKQTFITPSEYEQEKKKFAQRKARQMYTMIPIFKDETKQAFFEKEGFAVFPLLNEEEVNDLKSFYFSLGLKDEKGFGFHVSMDQTDKDLCRKVREKIWGVAIPKLEDHLKDFKPFVASFVVKEVNPKGVVPAHQDWSFVADEEDGFSSITCWIALVDTHLDNGGMGVIKGSHTFMMNHRPSPSPQCPVPLSDHMFSIFPYLHTIDMKAGDVLMFDNRTFHASPPNTSDGIRLAAGVGITQKNARLVHYYMKPDGTFNTMLRYDVDEDFFLRYENATLSRMYDKGEYIDGYGTPVEVAYSYTQYSSDELVALIKEAGNTFNVPMTEKLARLFGYSPDGQKKEDKSDPVSAPETTPETAEPEVWIDNRPFLIKYSPLNIGREIINRLKR